MRKTSIIIILAVFLLIALAAAAVFILPSISPHREQVSEQTYTVSELVDAAYALVDSSATEPYEKANRLFEAQIKNAKDADRRTRLRLAYADFLIGHDQAGHALDELRKIDEKALADEQKFHLYASFVSAYTQLGDTESSKIYEEKISALPQDVAYKGEGY
jgi:hypothetical protein